MKPEVKAPRDKDEIFLEKGIPAEIIPILRKAGYNLVQTLEGENPAKIQQRIIEIIKKYKLEVERPSQDEIKKWTE
jgi:lysyl-tRNA synthetase class 2